MTIEKIITYAKNWSDFASERFLQCYSLIQEEINYFKLRYKNNINHLNCIAYHHEKDTLVYERQLKPKIRTLSNSKIKI